MSAARDDPGEEDLRAEDLVDEDLPGTADRAESAWQHEASAWLPPRPGATDDKRTGRRVRRAGAAEEAAELRLPRRGGRHRRPSPPGPALLTVPSALRDLSVRPSRLAVLGLLVVLLLAALALGVRVAWARAGAQPHPVAAQAGGPLDQRTVPAGFSRATDAPSSGSTGAPAAADSPTGLPSAATVLLVHVVGQVRNPGVVRLGPGARVRDAIREAGGATRKADLTAVNLARPVADGEQVVLPRPGEQPTPLPGAPPVDAAAGGSGATPDEGTPLDLNAATAEQLEELPGVGPVLSERIVEWRTEHGRFSNVDELLEVSGIGDKMLAEIRPQVRV